jgi:Undecaprenyl-phosphate glucose phosphotransferase
MRAERLAWTDTTGAALFEPAPVHGGNLRDKRSTERSLPARRRRLLHRGAVRYAARTIDACVLMLMTLGLAMAAGADLLRLPLIEAYPYILLPVAGVAGVWLAGGYRFGYAASVAGHLLRVAAAGAGLIALLAGAGIVLNAADPALMTRMSALAAMALFVLHAGYQVVVRALTRVGALSDNVVIVGATQAASHIVARNARLRELNILGYFDDRAGRTPPPMGEAPFLGGIDDLLAWPRLPEVDRIVVTVTSTAQTRVRNMIDRLRSLPQEIILVLDLEGFNPEHTSLAHIADAPAAYISGAPRDVRRAAMKRLFDIVAALACCVVFALPVLAIALLVKLDSPGPVFFRQKRHGFNNQVIRVWKFRTMRPDKLAEQGVIVQTMPNDPRVTRIGRFLRRTSLDELPQLLNVLSGEMSLVGPRPHAVGMTAGATEVTRTVGDYAHRHRMKPGITGWAQVNGSRGPVHSAEDVRERVRLDMEYISRASVWFDIWIMLLTIPRLLGDRCRDR